MAPSQVGYDVWTDGSYCGGAARLKMGGMNYAPRLSHVLTLLPLFAAPVTLPAAGIHVASLPELNEVIPAAWPGNRIVVADGECASISLWMSPLRSIQSSMS